MWLIFASKREKKRIAQKLEMDTLAARGDVKTVQKAIRDLSQ